MRKFKRGLGYFLQYGLFASIHIWLIYSMGLKMWFFVTLVAIVFLAVLAGFIYLIEWLKK